MDRVFFEQLELFSITLVEPLDYLAFLELESKGKLVLTDSGGVQEEPVFWVFPA
jgi:UDP-N-acetylglucosamine 2-epimerase